MNRQLLAQLMRDKGLTDADFARATGCVQSTVHHWLSGKYCPRADVLKVICELLECSADDLLGIEIKKPDRLPRALASDLLKAVTKNGAYNSDLLHQMATTIRRFNRGKITEFERWLRNLAETLYAIELIKKGKKQPDTEGQQLSLLDSI